MRPRIAAIPRDRQHVNTAAHSQPALDRGHLVTAERTLIDILRASAAAHPDASAIDDGSEALSYAQLLDAVDAKADELRSKGVRPGDRDERARLVFGEAKVAGIIGNDGCVASNKGESDSQPDTADPTARDGVASVTLGG